MLNVQAALGVFYHVPRATRRERALLLLAGLFVVANRVALALVRTDPLGDLWPVLVWMACAGGAHVALDRLAPERDPLIFPTVMLLAGWGLTLVARLAPPFAARQAAWLVVSSAALVAMVALPPNLRVLQRYRYTWLLAGLALLAATFLFGVNPSGAGPRLWFQLGPLFFQPSEPLKLLLVVFLASYLAEKHSMILEPGPRLLGRLSLPPMAYFGPLLLMWGLCVLLLVWQRDMGAATLFFSVFLAMLYVSTGQSGYVLAGLVMLLAAGVAGYLVYDLVRLRVDAWWNPWPPKMASGRAFQIVQSLLALAAGGLFGQGVGQGSPYYVPVVHTDFVFAAIAEEWGILGALAALACIGVVVLRAMRIATNHARAPFRLLLAAGIGTLLAVQSLLIMGGVVKLVPLTGVTLPFVSYGGSSLLASFIMVGLLLRLSDTSQPLASSPSTTRTLTLSRR